MKKAFTIIGLIVLGAVISIPIYSWAQSYSYTNNAVTPVTIVNQAIPVATSPSNTTSTPLYDQPYYSYSFINGTNTTTTVKNATGFLHTLTLNNPNGSSSITVFDGTVASNTIIAQFTLPTATTSMPQSVLLDVAFLTNLTIQEKGNTSTITVSYR